MVVEVDGELIKTSSLDSNTDTYVNWTVIAQDRKWF